jgi:hypothetical protein
MKEIFSCKDDLLMYYDMMKMKKNFVIWHRPLYKKVDGAIGGTGEWLI